jgi:hypothetical protein
MKRIALFILLACISAFAQVPVTLSPQPVFTSYLADGTPNAFGCVFTYQSNTTTPQATYTDYTGTTLNPNPVGLTAGGTANIWLATGDLYSIVIKTNGGINCASGSTVLSVNGVSGYYGLLNLANTWYATQTFAEPIVISPLSFQIVTGVAPNQTTLNFPQPSGNVTLTFPSTAQNILGNLSPQITTPIINGCGMINGPGTYICIPNNSSVATILGGLAYLTGSPSTASSPSSVLITTGAAGVVVANAGITGTAIIQQSGDVSCFFDNATTAGDYVIISSVDSSHCYDDSDVSFPTSNVPLQVLGRVLATGSGGPTQMDLFGNGVTAPPPANVFGLSPILSQIAGSGAGTAPTFNCVGCYDNGGLIELTTGSAPAVNSPVVTITFGATHNGAACTLWPYWPASYSSQLSGAQQVAINSLTATAFAVQSGTTALAASTVYDWVYTCTFH